MKDLILCDLDGTLCDHSHRVHHVQKVGGNGLKRKPDWDAFYAEVKEDAPHNGVMTLLGHMLETRTVVFVTGRPERCRVDTVAWLEEYALHAHPLYMRKDGDFRADYIVKQEILDAHIDKDRVLFVLDDRQQVVDMWRRNGLVCFQVAEGDF